MSRRKSTKTLRVALWTFAILALLVVVFAVGASSWVGNFLKSESFRRMVSGHTGQALRAQAEFAPFQWTGPNVYSESLTVVGLPGSPLASLEATQVRATVDWRAAFGGAWRVESVDLLDVQLTLRPAEHVAEGEITASTPPTSAPGFLPTTFELGPVRAQRATILAKDSMGALQATLSDTALLFELQGASSEFSGTGGVLDVLDQPAIALESFRARLSKGEVFLTDARGRLGESGKLSASGQLGDRSELRVQWSDIDTEEVLSGDWRDRLRGQLSGEVHLRWESERSVSARGSFLLTEGLLREVPLLDRIATFTGSPQFRRMPLQEVSGRFVSQEGSWEIDELVLESKGLLRAEGNLEISEVGELNGVFRVGVAPQVLQWIPGSRERVFTTNQGGYVWTDVRVAGSLDNPTEDLSSRLSTAAAGDLIDRGTRALSDPAGTAKDGAQEILDILTPFLR